jgi:mRNA-degrading endonuclease RelE of RelBE toxin-antitoxin system
MSGKFRIKYATAVKTDLKAIPQQHHPLIQKKILEQLLHEPNVKTRNRKPMKGLGLSNEIWELRLGPGNCFRVFYMFDQNSVLILAIVVKEREKVRVGGEDFYLKSLSERVEEEA